MAGRILVTGGLGFIGSRLCHALLDEGCAVRCVDDLSGRYAGEPAGGAAAVRTGGAAAARTGGAVVARTGGAAVPRTGPAAAHELAARGAEVLVEHACVAHVRGVDAVVHLAARPGVRAPCPEAELRATNVELSDQLAAAARARGARFVLVSSSSVYGNAQIVPTPEHAPPAPLNPYARSKVAAERAVLAHAGDAVVVRPFTVYGPGQRPEMAFARWIAALQAGEPVPWHAAPGTARDFTYVDDAVAGLLAALRHGRAGETYNVSGWCSVDLREALALLGPPRVRELRCSTADARVTRGCERKAAAELGYEPCVDLSHGLERQLAAASPLRLAA